jgi:type VI secretion system secreted protein VgrG
VSLERRYHDNEGIQNAAFEAVLADGGIRKGTLDASGQAVLTDVPPGAVNVRFGPDTRSYTAAKRAANPNYRATISDADLEHLIAKHTREE